MKLITSAGALAVAALMVAPAYSQQEKLEPVVEKASSINESARKSQLTIDEISDDMQERLQQYKRILKEIDGLKVYTAQIEQQIRSQETEKQDIDNSIDQVSYVERQITPLMLRMIDSLESFVELDVPFLQTERSERLQQLNDLMTRANVDVSEKFRRVMEAYQIEADYGRNIEAYTAEHSINGQPQDVTFLRIGRVALIYKTRDGQQLGIWNQEKRSWQELDSKHLPAVEEAIRIARKQLAPDLLMMPLFAHKSTSTQNSAGQ
ncbi:DUF3450 domain-containing protein [Idiomarina sp. HP20-50]|uniref:DUF3450 domain-containing protein n=1 Tax=Idiomarina sp. HP20-50 TaxID=3070813 RepID=UPI00294AECE7|nr:DUF3450 domain-containing protein [Idiomarina sp. HP20-50]MDV6315688.1 DUF3450 domain-containing protein [Idiomarina sp. HP20-50]